MVSLLRVKVTLSGWPGGSGMNTFHFRASDGIEPNPVWAQDAVDRVRGFYDAIKFTLITSCNASFPSDTEAFEEEDGTLTQIIPVVPPAMVGGSDDTKHTSRATMLVSRLHTGEVVDGRLLQGRHYLGPIGNGSIDVNGQIDAADKATVAAAYAPLLVGGQQSGLVVWHRPKYDENHVLIRPGTWRYVSAVGVKDVPGVLRSRRD